MTKPFTSRRQLLKGAAASLTAASVAGACDAQVHHSEPAAPGGGSTAGGGSQPAGPSGIPRRSLGQSGLSVSILGFGGGVAFLDNPEPQWELLLDEAVSSGITYFDTAPVYYRDDDLHSEARFGQGLAPHRADIVLATKLSARDPELAKSIFEESLVRLRTDHVDILYVHQIRPEDNLEHLLDVMVPLAESYKAQGMARAIGISSMESPELSTEMIRRADLDVALFSFNATYWQNFAATAMAEARAKDMGLIVMKVVNGLVKNGVTADELLGHAWSEPGVACSLVGHTGLAHLRDNVSHARSWGQSSFDAHRRREVESKVAHLAGPHALPWARPGYTDGVV